MQALAPQQAYANTERAPLSRTLSMNSQIVDFSMAFSPSLSAIRLQQMRRLPLYANKRKRLPGQPEWQVNPA